MGNAAERLDEAITYLNHFTTSQEFAQIMRFRVLFTRSNKPIGAHLTILEEKEDVACMRYSRQWQRETDFFEGF